MWLAPQFNRFNKKIENCDINQRKCKKKSLKIEKSLKKEKYEFSDWFWWSFYIILENM